MASKTDYYDVLGVPATAADDEIRRAFRERVRACHPDRVANLDEDLQNLAKEKMVVLNEAYAVLRNPARRAAYDDRHSEWPDSTATTAPATMPVSTPGVPPSPDPATRPPPIRDPGEPRNRIGEQEFVARAASEEFAGSIKRAVPGNVEWTPIALSGTTLALKAARGRQRLYFFLLAGPRLDDKQLRRFLKTIDSWSSKLKAKLFVRERVFAFAAAVEFVHQKRLRGSIDTFNKMRKRGEVLQPATLIDLVNWHVAPGDADIATRLNSLIRGA